MTAPLRWPDKAEKVRMKTLSNIREIRKITLNITKVSNDVSMMRSLAAILELTHISEIDLLSVGARAEKEQKIEEV